MAHQHRRAIDDAVSLDGYELAKVTAASVVMAADAKADTRDPRVLLVGWATSSPSAVEASAAEDAVEGARTAREVVFDLGSTPSTPRGSQSGR